MAGYPLKEGHFTMRIFRREPAVWLYVINSAVALIVAYGVDLSQTQVAAVSTIATAFFAGWAAIITRPFVVSALTGAMSTMLTAAAAFGLHMSADQLSTTVTGLSIVLALVLRANVSPAGSESGVRRL